VIIEVHRITQLHRDTIIRWHEGPIDNPYEGFMGLVCSQHEQNFRLWHQEGVARSPDASDAEIAQVKRTIDKLNQRRNDLIEKLDEALLEKLTRAGVVPKPEAGLNTETRGSAIDRLSILALRIYHMEEQAQRSDADQEHRERARARLVVLYRQHEDLSCALGELLEDLFAGRKILKLYRQFKMYNDPTLNPYLYNARNRPAA